MAAWSTKKIVGLILGIVFILGLGLLGSFYFLVVGIIKGSEPYKISTEFIRENPVVIESIGEIKRLGWFPSGEVQVKNGSGKADINIDVSGKKGKGRVYTYFYRQAGQWVMNNASLVIADSSEILPLLSLEITSVSFHGNSSTGPVNERKEYELNETIYWNVVVEKAHKKGGEVSLQESLTIKDKNNQVIMENPSLIVFNEKVDMASVQFTNNATITDAGEYTFITTVTDRFSDKKAIREDKVKIVHSKTLKISDLSFHDQDISEPKKTEPIYKIGDSVYVTFQVIGFVGQEGRISLTEDLYVLNEKGEDVIKEPGILKIDEAWQAEDILSLRNKIDVPATGRYQLKVVMHDNNSGEEFTETSEFVIE